MTQEELDALETSFRNHGFTWNQTNFAVAVIRNHVEPLRQQLATVTADRDRLLGIMCEIAGSKSLTATPTQFYQYLQRVASDATITNPEALAATDELRQQLAAKQAEVDALMLEYCPSEMSQEQLDNWATHQQPSKEQGK